MASSEDRFGGGVARLASAGAPAITSRYVVALVALGGALLFRYVFSESLGFKVPYLHFYPAIMVAAWYGGLGPGILITVLSAVVAMYSLLPPAGMGVADSADQLSLGVFVATGLVISVAQLPAAGGAGGAAHRSGHGVRTSGAARCDPQPDR